MSEPAFATALSHRLARHGAQGLAIQLREVSETGMIDVRGLPDDAAFMAAVRGVLGFDLPTVPRTSAGTDGTAALWLSVDQWLVVAERGKVPGLVRSLTDALKGIHSLCVDMSDARTIFRLEGDGVGEVLNKGTSVDFTTGEHGPGSVRRLRYAEIAAMVHVLRRDPDAVDLYVFRSYADYAWDFLVTTAKDAARLRLFGQQDAPRT